MISSSSFLNSLLAGIMLSLLLCGAATAVTAPPEAGPRIAVFPMENLSGTPVPLMELNAEFAAVLKSAGMHIVETAAVENFINTHRVRYVGGIDEKTAALLSAETGADSVLITSLEFYNEVAPPKFSLVSRLVSLQDIPEIIWMDSVGIAGDDAPGILGLGLITDIRILRKNGLAAIGTNLERFTRRAAAVKTRLISMSKEEDFRLEDLIKAIKSEKRLLAPGPERRQKPVEEQPGDGQRSVEDGGELFLSRYNPVGWYSSREISANQEHIIAIIPFFNRSTRKHAAELQALHLANQLVDKSGFRILELGVIRDRMLNMHVIMTSGISLPAIDLITISLGSDLLLSGVVFDYLDTVGYGSSPRVDFSMQLFNREDKKILWSSHSSNRGDDGVYLFDYGRVATAATLSDKMCRALVQRLVEDAVAN